MKITKIALFKGKKIRKTIHNNEWWFSVVDIIEALTGTERPRKYWSDLKKILANDGKNYFTDCADTEGIFRIIQSIPSPKAEPFKRWFPKKII